MTPEEVAIRLLAPLLAQVGDWVSGKTNERPTVLNLLPAELQSEAALERAKARQQPEG